VYHRGIGIVVHIGQRTGHTHQTHRLGEWGSCVAHDMIAVCPTSHNRIPIIRIAITRRFRRIRRFARNHIRCVHTPTQSCQAVRFRQVPSCAITHVRCDLCVICESSLSDASQPRLRTTPNTQLGSHYTFDSSQSLTGRRLDCQYCWEYSPVHPLSHAYIHHKVAIPPQLDARSGHRDVQDTTRVADHLRRATVLWSDKRVLGELRLGSSLHSPSCVGAP